MRRALAVILLTLSFATVSASAAPRGDDGTFFDRLRRVVQRLTRQIGHITGTSDLPLPPKP